jgi:hypothetical protein
VPNEKRESTVAIFVQKWKQTFKKMEIAGNEK